MGEVTLYRDRVVVRRYGDPEEVRPAGVAALVPLLFHQLEIDPAFRFGDLCRLLDKPDSGLLDLILSEDVTPLLEEARLPPPKIAMDLQFLRVHNLHEEGRLLRDFDGWGRWPEGHPGGPRTGPISVSLLPAHHLTPLPLRYEPTLAFRDASGVVVHGATVGITLIEFLKAVFYDLTFAGRPAERDRTRAELERLGREMRGDGRGLQSGGGDGRDPPAEAGGTPRRTLRPDIPG